MEPEIGRVAVQRRLLVLAAALSAIAGVLSLVGWGQGRWWLKGGFFPDPIHANGAATLVLFAAAALCLARTERWARAVALGASALAAVLALAAISAHAGGPGDVLDAALVPGAVVPAEYARMSTMASITALGLAAAVWMRIFAPTNRRAFLALLLVPTAVTFVALMGLAFGADVLTHPIGGGRPAPLGALSFNLLCLGLALDALDPRVWARMNDTTPGMRLVRRLVPFSLVWLVTGGLVLNLRLTSYGHGHETDVAVVILLSGFVISGLVVYAGIRFDRQLAEIERSRAEVDAAGALAYQQALELNDDVVQMLATAWLAHDLGRHDQERDAVREALGRAQGIASTLLRSTAGDGPVQPGGLVRDPLGPTDVR